MPPASIESAARFGIQMGFTWLAGLREACCFHRGRVLPCLRSKKLVIRMGQCFLLNGIIFLGSLFILNSIVIPTLLWILPDKCEQFDSRHSCEHGFAQVLYSFLRSALINLFYFFWFYPLYGFSYVLSFFWYSDIAKHGFDVVSEGSSKAQSPNETNLSDTHNATDRSKPGGLEGLVQRFGEQFYSFLLLGIFCIEVFASGFTPYIGKIIQFLLQSWMYSYYCFEYKWNLSELSLDKRLDIFESNWAFFAGFGSPCGFVFSFFSMLVGNGIMGVLFPLFVLTAAATQAEKVIDSQKIFWGWKGQQKLKIFYVADILSMRFLQLFPDGYERDD